MGRIGVKSQQGSRIYSYALDKYEEPFNMKGGQMTGYLALDDVNPFYNQIVDAPFKLAFKFEDVKPTEKMIKEHRERIRFNKTDYEIKVGKRSEGTIFGIQDGKPYIERGSSSFGDTMFGNAPSMDMLTKQQQKYLTTPIPVQPVKETYFDKGKAETFKLQEPTERDIIVDANRDPNDFISMNLGELEVYPSTNAGYNEEGSNIRRDMMKDAQMPEPMTKKQLFEMNYLSPQSTSGMMNTKQGVLKSKAILNWYGGSYSPPQTIYNPPNPPAHKMDFQMLDMLNAVKEKTKTKKAKKEVKKEPEQKFGKLKVPSPFE